MREEIIWMEAKLRAAMLKSDIAMLDNLLDESLQSVGPDGAIYNKEDDLKSYRTRTTQLARIDISEMVITRDNHIAIVIALAELSGLFMDEYFEVCNRYTRTWSRRSGEWRVIAGSVCAVLG